MDTKAYELLLKYKLEGAQDNYDQVKQQLGDVLSKAISSSIDTALDQSLAKFSQKMQGIWVDKNTFQPVGGGTAAPTPNSPAFTTTPPPMNGFSGLGGARFPGSVYAASLTADMPFSRLGGSIGQMAASPFYQPNFRFDLATSDAAVINAGRSAGINSPISKEYREILQADRDEAKKALQEASQNFLQLSLELRKVNPEILSIASTFEELSKKASEGNQRAKEFVAQLSNQKRAESDFIQATKRYQGLDQAVGESSPWPGRLGMAGGLMGIAAAIPFLARRAQVGAANLDNFGARAMMNGNYSDILSMHEMGGYSNLRSAATTESIIGIGSQLVLGGAALMSGNPMAQMIGGGAAIRGLNQAANFSNTVTGSMRDILAANTEINSERRNMQLGGIDYSLSAVGAARGAGNIGYLDSMMLAPHYARPGMAFGVNDWARVMGNAAAGMGAGHYYADIGGLGALESLGMSNATGVAGGLYRSGRAASGVAADLQGIYAGTGVYGGDSAVAQALFAGIGGRAGMGYGAGSAALGQTQYAIGAAGSAWGDLNLGTGPMAQRMVGHYLDASGHGGDMLGRIAGLSGLEKFRGGAGKALGLTDDDLYAISADLGSFSADDIAALAKKRGVDIDGKEASRLHQQMLKDVMRGGKGLGLSGYQERMFVKKMFGANTFGEVDKALSLRDATPGALTKDQQEIYDKLTKRAQTGSTEPGDSAAKAAYGIADADLQRAATILTGGMSTLGGTLKAVNAELEALIKRAQNVLAGQPIPAITIPGFMKWPTSFSGPAGP